MSDSQLKPILESLIMVSTSPMTADKLCQCIDDEAITTKEVREAIAELMEDYKERGIELVKVASGYRFQAQTKYKQWYQKLFEEKPAKYSRATLETLAIIAYRQPVTRADIESVRGVAVSSSIMKTLLEREWIKVVGHRDVPGKPSIYATTKSFLDYFNLEKLDDLPTLAEIKDISDVLSEQQAKELVGEEVAEEGAEVEAITAVAETAGLEATLEDELLASDDVELTDELIDDAFEPVAESMSVDDESVAIDDSEFAGDALAVATETIEETSLASDEQLNESNVMDEQLEQEADTPIEEVET